MGIAAYNRGSRALSVRLDREATPNEIILMRDLNSEPRNDSALTPFGEIVFVPSHGGWWAMCPVTGFGFWFTTLRSAVRGFRVTIVGVRFSHGDSEFRAIPGMVA
jgi:hypothetical protein